MPHQLLLTDCIACTHSKGRCAHAPWQGFPGTVQAAVTYTLTADSRLLIDFEATSDAPTPIAMGQHTYFNLDGVAAPCTVLEHQLLVNG